MCPGSGCDLVCASGRALTLAFMALKQGLMASSIFLRSPLDSSESSGLSHQDKMQHLSPVEFLPFFSYGEDIILRAL